MTPLSQEDVDEAYQIAMTYCADCRDYHATRPYLAAAGLRTGAAGDRLVLGPLIREFAPPRAQILIAGTGDGGLVDLLLDEIGSTNPSITVADRCPTPLFVSRRNAERRSVGIQTRAVDLVEGELGGSYDLIVSHAVLPFIPPVGRQGFLRNLGTVLAPAGTLILAYPTDPSSLGTAGFVEKTLAGLAAKGISLPNPPGPLLDALSRITNSGPRDFDSKAIGVPGLVEAAGLRVDQLVESPRRVREVSPGLSLGTPARDYLIIRRPS